MYNLILCQTFICVYNVRLSSVSLMSDLCLCFRDRKRKRFVTDSKEGVKKVKTESGNWIPASYKSNLYPLLVE